LETVSTFRRSFEAKGDGMNITNLLRICLFASILIAFNVPKRLNAAEELDGLNQYRINMLTGSSQSIHARIGADIARVINGQNGLRIVPYLSAGSVQNLDDLMAHDSIELALINSDVLVSRRVQAPDDFRLRDVNYFARLFTNEMHLIARNQSGITNISDLNNLRVAAGETGSGTFLTASLLLRSMGIQSRVIAVPEEEALRSLANGTVDAVFVLAGTPARSLHMIKEDAGLHLVNIPLSRDLESVYGSEVFTSKDYPNLVQKNPVTTITVDVILAGYGDLIANSAKHLKLASFVEALEGGIDQLRTEPNHPKWSEFIFSDIVQGWKRNKAANDYLPKNQTGVDQSLNIKDLMLEEPSK
jgi:TRAP transporter TAXI family solute receptor